MPSSNSKKEVLVDSSQNKGFMHRVISDKGLRLIKRIFSWGLFACLGFLMYEALFVFPLEKTAWGFQNDHVIVVLIFCCGTIIVGNYFKIDKLTDIVNELKSKIKEK